MGRPPKGDSNLFAIDHDAIRATLADANGRLLGRRDDLLTAFSRVPELLATEEDVDRARRFAGQLDQSIRNARQARLSDGRPFRDAVDSVKDFFGEIEKPLQAALRVILKRLTDAAQRGRPKQSDPPVPAPSTPVGIDTSGETIITAAPNQPPRSAGIDGEIRLAWSIEGFDIATLDLEALRNYLTKASILAACRKHLADHGPRKLSGVAYREVALPE